MGSMSRQLGWEEGIMLFISDVGRINHLLELIVRVRWCVNVNFYPYY